MNIEKLEAIKSINSGKSFVAFVVNDDSTITSIVSIAHLGGQELDALAGRINVVATRIQTNIAESYDNPPNFN